MLSCGVRNTNRASAAARQWWRAAASVQGVWRHLPEVGRRSFWNWRGGGGLREALWWFWCTSNAQEGYNQVTAEYLVAETTSASIRWYVHGVSERAPGLPCSVITRLDPVSTGLAAGLAPELGPLM